MASREQNETEFGRWEELPGGGGRYFRDYTGRVGGRARYIKEVPKMKSRRASRRKFTIEKGR